MFRVKSRERRIASQLEIVIEIAAVKIAAMMAAVALAVPVLMVRLAKAVTVELTALKINNNKI